MSLSKKYYSCSLSKEPIELERKFLLEGEGDIFHGKYIHLTCSV